MTGYFDYNATAPLHPRARQAVAEWMADPPGNPSSMHSFGRRARVLIDTARDQVASLLGVDSERVVFTSGATEANNLILRGITAILPDITVVTSVIDHASIMATVDALEARGRRVERLAVDSQGRIDLPTLARITHEHPSLVATSWANGESGHITDIDALLAHVAADTFVHLDAAQAAGRLALHCGNGIASVGVSAHKFGGPPGIGALALAPDAPRPEALLTGGPQEHRLRAGTENALGIVGMAAAAMAALETMSAEWNRLQNLRERLWRHLSRDPGQVVRITPETGLANTLTIAVAGCTGDVIVSALDLEGFAVSTGSACAAGAPEPSHVVAGIGIPAPYREGVVRISMGVDTTSEKVDTLAGAFAMVVKRARELR